MSDLNDLQTLEIILTSRCNLCCSYCCQNARTARSMEWETLRASLDLILRSRREKVALLFIRGEPLLEFRLLRRAVEYVEDVQTIVISPDITDQPQWELNRIDELDRAFECVYRLCLDHLQRTLR